MIRSDRTPRIKSIGIQCCYVWERSSLVLISSPIHPQMYWERVISHRSTHLRYEYDNLKGTVKVRKAKPQKTRSTGSEHYFFCENQSLGDSNAVAVMCSLYFSGEWSAGRLPPIFLSPLNAARIHDTLNWNFPSVNILHHQVLLTGGAWKKKSLHLLLFVLHRMSCFVPYLHTELNCRCRGSALNICI